MNLARCVAGRGRRGGETKITHKYAAQFKPFPVGPCNKPMSDTDDEDYSESACYWLDSGRFQMVKDKIFAELSNVKPYDGKAGSADGAPSGVSDDDQLLLLVWGVYRAWHRRAAAAAAAAATELSSDESDGGRPGAGGAIEQWSANKQLGLTDDEDQCFGTARAYLSKHTRFDHREIVDRFSADRRTWVEWHAFLLNYMAKHQMKRVQEAPLTGSAAGGGRDKKGGGGRRKKRGGDAVATAGKVDAEVQQAVDRATDGLLADQQLNGDLVTERQFLECAEHVMSACLVHAFFQRYPSVYEQLEVFAETVKSVLPPIPQDHDVARQTRKDAAFVLYTEIPPLIIGVYQRACVARTLAVAQAAKDAEAAHARDKQAEAAKNGGKKFTGTIRSLFSPRKK